jgi:hypothetical protein
MSDVTTMRREIVRVPAATGPPGPPTTLSIGTVAPGGLGATVTGEAPNQTLNLTIPLTTLAIGTVISGEETSASITGTPPALVLDLVLPRGATGSPGTTTWAGITDKPTALRGFVFHDANAATARPTGYPSIEWLGSVEPNNMENGDTWVVLS